MKGTNVWNSIRLKGLRNISSEDKHVRNGPTRFGPAQSGVCRRLLEPDGH